MKKTALSIIVFFLLLCFLFPAALGEHEQFTLRVGYWEGYGINTNANGNLQGYQYEYMKEIARINHWELEFIETKTWLAGLEMLENGEIDVFGAMNKSEERLKNYAFPDSATGYEFGALFVQKDNSDIYYNDWDSFDQKTVGTAIENFYLTPFVQLVEKKGITVHLRHFETVKDMSLALQSGEVDMILSGDIMKQMDVKLAAHIQVEPFYYATSKDNQYVLNGINKAMQTIKLTNFYFDAQLYEKFYGRADTSHKLFTAEENALIEEAPVLKIGYDAHWAPMEYTDAKTNEARGIHIDLLKRVEEYTGLRFEFVPFTSFEDCQEKLAAKEIDIVSGVVGNEETAGLYDVYLSDVIMKIDMIFVGKRGNIQLESTNMKLALPSTWVGTKLHMETYYPHLQIVQYDNIEECLEAVNSEKADFTMQNIYAVDYLFSSSQYEHLIGFAMRNGNMSFGLGVAKYHDIVLLDILNKAIQAIDEESINQAVFAYTAAMPYKLTIGELVKNYALPIGGTIIGLLCVALFFIMLSKAKLNRVAFYDPLTKEMNLEKFKLEVQKLLSDSHMTEYAICAIDVQRFKAINDLYGYEFGDKVLIRIAETIRFMLEGRGCFCRSSGDKFYLLRRHENFADFQHEFNVFTKMIETVQVTPTRSCKIVVNFGVYQIQSTDKNVTSIIDRANIACKSVKRRHTSGFAVYNQSMYDTINAAKEIENTMSVALENKEFVVYLQPKFDLKTLCMVGAEALVRWNRPCIGLIQPNAFIPLFEDNGFIMELDYFVFEEVCKLLEGWKKQNNTVIPISINLSRRHLENGNAINVLQSILSRYEVDAGSIEIELTESAFVACELEAIVDFLEELRHIGFLISVDDFGSGYSSLALLKDLPIDVLKLDKSFVNGSGRKVEILLENCIRMSKSLKIVTVCEGIETKEQAELLKRLGSDIGQGYFFEYPIPIADFEQKYMGQMMQNHCDKV